MLTTTLCSSPLVLPTPLDRFTPLRQKFFKMVCSVICRNRLLLVQSRIKRDWYLSTVTMLQNQLELQQFTLELPWPAFTPASARNKIRLCYNYLVQANREIQHLELIVNNGCQWCNEQTNN